MGPEGDREDVILDQPIVIVPDRPPLLGRTEKQREREMDQSRALFELQQEEAVPAYREIPGSPDAGPSTWRPTLCDDSEQEYDEYEEGASADAAARPPRRTACWK